ncbi:Bifunctional thiamine biosynthesis protein ThiDN [uncultured archaeon]|nr:Bifunctional thiamine biosynthesis protein ThiDN [uncultured archaeon]
MAGVVLTIGGSDSGGGAGIQADIKTFSALGLHGTSAITAITAQNTLGVQRVFGLGPEVVYAQLRSITDDFSIATAKTGMLHSADIVAVVSRHLQETGIPLVLDPVIEAEAGGRLLRPDAVQAVKEQLMPLARVVTPNIFEAEALTEIPVRDIAGMKQAAYKIMEMGPGAVIIKGGHLDCTDLLMEGEDVSYLPGDRVAGGNHGVGCTFSAALTSYLALGNSLKDSAKKAKDFAREALRGSMNVGHGVGPVNQTSLLREEAKRLRALCDKQRRLTSH